MWLTKAHVRRDEQGYCDRSGNKTKIIPCDRVRVYKEGLCEEQGGSALKWAYLTSAIYLCAKKREGLFY